MFAKTFLRVTLTAALFCTAAQVSAFAPSSTSFKAGVNRDTAIVEKLSSIAISRLDAQKDVNKRNTPSAKLDKKHAAFKFLMAGTQTSKKPYLVNVAAR